LLRIEGLRTVFRRRVGDIPAMDGLDVKVLKGRTLGIVGQSSCTKSILSLSVMRLGASQPAALLLMGAPFWRFLKPPP
jgi:peptide/nickel transport system ATP-binding protein